MTAPGLLVATCAGLAVALVLPVPPRLGAAPAVAPSAEQGWMRRFRLCWSLCAALAVATFLAGPAGMVGGVAAGIGCWVVIGRSEPPAVRREREEVRRDLPHVVGLFADALRSGQAPPRALGLVCAALPGPATARLAGAIPRLEVGLDPARVWEELADDDALAPLGRTLARAQASGAPVVASVERLGQELASSARAEVEDRARAVGVKAALPLGLCLLPAFILVGIVPVVAGLLSSLGL